MIDIKQDLVTLLKTASSWDAYYELMYKPGTLPAITYIEVDNADLFNGDTIDYSTLRYEIKIWSKSMSEIASKSAQIDTAMKTAGWSRYMAMETNDNNTIVKVLRYVAIGYNEV
jgi:hypothetical protein